MCIVFIRNILEIYAKNINAVSISILSLSIALHCVINHLFDDDHIKWLFGKRLWYCCVIKTGTLIRTSVLPFVLSKNPHRKIYLQKVWDVLLSNRQTPNIHSYSATMNSCREPFIYQNCIASELFYLCINISILCALHSHAYKSKMWYMFANTNAQPHTRTHTHTSWYIDAWAPKNNISFQLNSNQTYIFIHSYIIFYILLGQYLKWTLPDLFYRYVFILFWLVYCWPCFFFCRHCLYFIEALYRLRQWHSCQQSVIVFVYGISNSFYLCQIR